MGFKDEIEIKTAEDIVNEQLSTEPLPEEKEKDEETVKAEETKEETVEDEEKETESEVREESDTEDDKEAENESVEDTKEDDIDDEDSNEEEEEETPKKKKSFILQPPIIIAACILLGSLLGYFIFVSFFHHDPTGLWKVEDDEGTTYYYEFNDDNTCKLSIGSLDNIGGYEYMRSAEGATITVNQISASTNYYIGLLEGSFNCQITGSRLFGNQKMLLDQEGYTLELTQVRSKENHLTKPENFTPKEELLGSWEMEIPYYNIKDTFTFNKDGTMVFNLMDTTFFNGTYTYDDENIYMTMYTTEESTSTLPYELNGDVLHILEADFIRVGADPATVDQLSQSTDDEI
ncbi:MAG: hypothetical protein IJJ15_00855 [Ruminococcus sp.]|nr:hypothetical protein [Ruminococcus sp.]